MGSAVSRTILVYEAVSGGGMVGRDLPASWAREGSAIRRALVADFAAVPGVRVVETVDARCLDRRPAPAGVTRIVADPARPVDPAGLARAADAAVIVAPEADGQLHGLAAAVADGGRSLGPTAAAVRLCGDKLRLAAAFGSMGVPTPPTVAFIPAAGLPAIEAPSGWVVVKPVDGAGAIDTFVLAAGGRCPPALLDRAAALIQPFRPGAALSASFLVDRAGRPHLVAVGRQRIEVGPGGRLLYAGGDLPVPSDGLDLDPVRKALAVPGLLGFVGVDFVAVGPAGAVEVIEINPRPTTSIVGLVRLAPPGTIARAWLDCLDAGAGPEFRPDADFRAIRSAPAVRFDAAGPILPPPEVPR